MHRAIHKIICWILTLSLAGLPYISVSADMLTQSEPEPCDEMSMDSQLDSEPKASLEEKTDCCNDACQCPVMAVCHSNLQNQVTVFSDIFTTLKRSIPDQVISIYINNYHSRSTPPDIQPPIV